VDGGQVHRGVQAVVGDLVSVGVRDAGDEVEAGLSALGRDDPRLAVRPHRGAARSHPNHRHVSRGRLVFARLVDPGQTERP
jgi:hypothetical protein